MTDIFWKQHAIGQGGFHTGRMLEDGAVFNWVFDCGAKNGRQFEKYLLPWVARQREPVDWLFVSHFDFDHVSGLETLMSRCVVKNVMLPYVDDAELVIALLSEIRRGGLRRSFVEMIADPAAFFLSRGAQSVTFLGGSGPDEPADTAAPERPRGYPDRPDGEKYGGGWFTKIDKQVAGLAQPAWAALNSAVSAVGTIRESSCAITIASHSTVLLLRPFCAPITQTAHQKLLADLQALVGKAPCSSGGRPGLKGLAFAVATHVRTSTGRGQLRALHKLYVGSSNRASLSLLSKPLIGDRQRAYWHVRGPLARQRWGDKGGSWINTGDAELLATADLADWTRCYASHLPDVLVLALPHHGSDKNSDGNLQALCPRAVLAAHAKSTNSKHPGPNVSLVAGRRLVCVSEDRASEVSMVCSIN